MQFFYSQSPPGPPAASTLQPCRNAILLLSVERGAHICCSWKALLSTCALSVRVPQTFFLTEAFMQPWAYLLAHMQTSGCRVRSTSHSSTKTKPWESRRNRLVFSDLFALEGVGVPPTFSWVQPVGLYTCIPKFRLYVTWILQSLRRFSWRLESHVGKMTNTSLSLDLGAEKSKKDETNHPTKINLMQQGIWMKVR